MDWFYMIGTFVIKELICITVPLNWYRCAESVQCYLVTGGISYPNILNLLLSSKGYKTKLVEKCSVLADAIYMFLLFIHF